MKLEMSVVGPFQRNFENKSDEPDTIRFDDLVRFSANIVGACSTGLNMIQIKVDNVPITGLTVGQLCRPPQGNLLPVHTMVTVHSSDPAQLKDKITADVHYSAFAYVEDTQ